MNRRSVLNVLGALAVLAGCTRVEGETAVTVPQPVQHEALTTDPTLGRFVLLAEDRVETGPRSVVRGGDVGSRGGADGWSVVIGNRGRVEGGNILAASVKLRHGAVVEDVQTERFSGGDATHGLVMPLVVTVPELPAASAVTPGHADVRVRPRTSRTLEAGRFDSVEVSSRGTLRLTGGVYELRTLEVGANARIEASAPSELRVLGRVRMGRGATVGANSGVARDLRIESGAGTAERDRGDDNEEREEDDDHACGSPVEIQAEARVTALLLAPRARVHVGSEVVLVGAIAGRSIHLGPRAEASFQGGLGGGCSAQSCDDGNACNGVETCEASGVCTAGVPPVVDDGNRCTVDACDPATGVTHVASAAGTACGDGNACNGDETCDGVGACAGGTAPPVNDGNPCTVDGCDPATGVTHVASAAGTACGDGNACNGDEACDGAGACAGGTAPPVDDGNPCTVDGCDPATGVTHVASAAGTACGDGNTCNGDETCDGAGTCAAGMPPALDDGNPCTVDACEPGTGVTHVTLPPTDGCWLSVDNDGDAFTENGGDCNDADAAIHPGATEACGNGVDEDCSGADLACGGIPTLVAPPLDPSVTTTMLAATAFLYTGPGAVQTGVAPGTITAERVAVLRGLVMTRDGVALPGVRITVRDHTEFGSTLSRLDGWFDLAVNGGGLLMLQYRMEGYVEVERRLEVPWRDYLVVPEVAMVALDPVVTQIDFSTLMEVAVARGSVSSDADGERQATLLFAPGSTAELVFTDDTTVPISQVTLRQTEVTVGPNGQRAMPADLPTNSAYTYAVDLRVEEAVAAGAAQLRVSPPVSFYVENFLNFPVGGHVPAAWYRPEGMAWIGAEDALVIKVLSVTDGAADLDVTGSGTPSDEATLGGLGITAAERVKLAELYVPNATVWRTRLQHFSLWDLNGSNPWDVPQDPAPVVPPLPSPRETEPAPMDDNCEEPAHSTVDIQNQLVKERLPLVGTPHTLHYRSDRVPGRQDGHVLKIPLTGPEPPMRLVGVKVEVSVAGNREYLEFETLQPNMIHTYHWSGLDAYGRKPQGSQPVSVNIGYVYRMTYRIPMICCPSSVGLLCGQGGACCISWEDACMASGYLFSVETRDVDETAWTTTRGELSGPLGVWDVKAVGLGGWSLDSHHTYDPGSKRLFLGTGRTRSAEELPRALRVMSDDGQIGVGDEPAAQSLGIMADGAALVARSQTHEVVRLSQDGEVTRIAGTGEFGDDGDGGPAVEARLRYPVAAVVAVDGSILIADAGARKVRRVGVDGVISTVFMDSEFQGAMAAVPDGSIVFGASVWLKRWLPDGRVVTAAGNGTWGTSGDNGPAGQAALTTVEHVAVGPDGTVYLTSSQPAYLRKVIPGGTISRVAGNGTDAFAGDGVQGPDTGLGQVHALTVGPNGSVYVAATVWGGAARVLILEVTPDGRVRRVAGRGPYAWRVPAVGAALNTPLGWQSGLAVAPDGMLWILENGGNRLRRVEPALPSVAVGDIVIPSENGGEVYVFDLTGRHLRTLDGSTNAVVRTFTYEGGQLAGVTDADGGTTEIERDGAGNATGIVSAKGQRTMLQVDGNGDLVAVTDPAGNAVQMSYYPGGLLEQFTNARGFASYYGYDELGRLTSDSDTVGGYVALARTEGVGQAVVTKRLAEGAAATYGFGRGVSGGSSRTVTNTFADGTQVTSTRDDSGVVRVTRADGTQLETASGPDPRFGMLAPITVSRTRRTPAGKVQTQTVTRTATLANPDDPLSLVAEHEERTVNGRVSTRDYDAVTRTTVTRSPEGRTQRWVTDEKGRVTEHEAGGLVPARMSYDAEGRLMGVASGLRTTTLEYDSLGRLAVVTDPAGQTVGLAYDDANRVTEQTLADGNTVRLRYDANGNVVGVTPPGRPEHAFQMNAVDLEEQYIPPNVGFTPRETTKVYNVNRQLTRIIRPDGKQVVYGYDPANRVSTVDFSRGQIGYAYDGAGRVETVTAPEGVQLAYTYEGALLTSTTSSGPVSGSVGFSFNSEFGMASRTVNGGLTVVYSYGDDGLLAQAGELLIARDPMNGLVTGTKLVFVEDAFEYDGFGEVTGYNAQFTGTTIFSESFLRDNLGRITTKTETVLGETHVYSYGYHSRGWLTDVWVDGVRTSHYEYDVNGNRVAHTTADGAVTTAAFDYQDRLLRFGDFTYTYTPNGELATKTTKAGEVTSFSYDEFGNLVEVALSDGRHIAYITDPHQRRIGKRVDGVVVQGFIYEDQLRIAAEMDGGGHTRSVFAYSTSPNSPEILQDDARTWRVLKDHLGSPRVVVDVSSGAVVARLDYNEFGLVTSEVGAGAVPHGFAGGLYDRDTGLLRFGARDYDPTTGRWTSKDPIGFAGQDTNLFAYAANDPVNFVDQTGHLLFAPIVAGALWGAASDMILQLLMNGGSLECINWESVLMAGGLGAFGGWMGVLGKGVKGLEFSHFLPKRWIGGLGGALNGNWVPSWFHIATDPFRFRFVSAMAKPTTFQFPPGIAQLLRTPGWLAGGSLGAAAVESSSQGGPGGELCQRCDGP